MTPTQEAIWRRLERCPGQVVSYQELCKATGRVITTEQLRVQVCLLRSEIKASGRGIKTRWGYGYMATREDGNGLDTDP